MTGDLTEHLTQLETQRIDALLTVDTARFDTLHDDAYELCNPTGTVWDKIEYRQRLVTGRLAYSRLETTSGIDVLVSGSLAVLRYRCLIAVRVDGNAIPAHECRHIDTYTLAADGRWRCRYSQATGIMDTIPTPARTHNAGDVRNERGVPG
ncbi:nuclear transport factor 2 family protein [Pseudonocardiaceae bacterium YIM PH 21723]|nr:nuclear transport factor 2 family protein [Pseudonocardiaceae bacterium YIM PH 21723]